MFPYDTSPSGEDFLVQTRKAAQGIPIGISKPADATGVPDGQSPLGRGGAKSAPEPSRLRGGEVKRLQRRRRKKDRRELEILIRD